MDHSLIPPVRHLLQKLEFFVSEARGLWSRFNKPTLTRWRFSHSAGSVAVLSFPCLYLAGGAVHKGS